MWKQMGWWGSLEKQGILWVAHVLLKQQQADEDGRA